MNPFLNSHSYHYYRTHNPSRTINVGCVGVSSEPTSLLDRKFRNQTMIEDFANPSVKPPYHYQVESQPNRDISLPGIAMSCHWYGEYHCQVRSQPSSDISILVIAWRGNGTMIPLSGYGWTRQCPKHSLDSPSPEYLFFFIVKSSHSLLLVINRPTLYWSFIVSEVLGSNA